MNLKILEVAKLQIQVSFWKQIVSGDCSEAILSSGRRLGIEWKEPSFILGLIHIDYASLMKSYGLKDKQLIFYFGLYNIAQELATSKDGISVFTDDGLELHFVKNYRNNLAINAADSFRQFVLDLQSKAEKYLRLATHIVFSYEF
ncbi:hypothetical protein [Paenibacillus aceris]|uniref:SMI1/KNR4 family protein n=1 Tax=Paenibacillus aceris TaxID=869555 RepID=A0ABS4I9D2_9BACL|nr:hypothetical protein [Paenibacillus aceris]MBP1967542.1 hypothetical protein [Paenibacillus aceris]NHW36302.1 hypothetical protein [Paenibacillus aceris]